MIDNYLVNARLRFDQDREFKAKQKQEQQEQHDKMKRDIYLNGGFVDCVNPGCVAQGTADTSYLCKSCYHEQMRPPAASKQPQQPLIQPPAKSYINPPRSPSHISSSVKSSGLGDLGGRGGQMEVDGGLIVPVFANPRPPITPPPPPIKMVGHIVPVAVSTQPPQPPHATSTTNVAQMRVKLPPPGISANSSGSSPSHLSSSSHPCKNSSCEFYGTPELDYFCSKCSKKAQISSR